MEYTTLGGTGMTVSRLCLGCMTFGTPGWRGREWLLDESEAQEILETAIDLGITFFDTSNNYSYGESERILGTALDGHHDKAVISTKVYSQMDEANPNSGGLSRKTIDQELNNSLDRLGTETIDLYHIHRWDGATPIEETLRTLDDAVRRGAVRYLGASSMWTHQFADALQTAKRLNTERFVTMQNHYNLVYREEEREMIPLCLREGIGVVPWSPLARGYLTRPHSDRDQTDRGSGRDTIGETETPAYHESGGKEINERVEELAIDKGVTMAQLSLSWLLHKDVVDAPIIGVTSVDHLKDAVEALDISLTTSEIDYLEEPYQPRPIIGHE